MVQPPSDAAPRPRGRSEEPSETHIQFRAALARTMRREWVTDALVAINVAVYAAMVVGGVSPIVPNNEDLLDWGANFGPLTLHGEPWRLLTSVFVHGGVIHLGFNMYFLTMVGRLVERLYGHVGFALTYVFAGLLGSTASVLYHGSMPSVGASGAIFGTLGALLAFLLRRRALLPPQVLRPMRVSVLSMVVLNIAFGLSMPGIDNAAHLGGLGGGFFAGLLLAPSLGETGLKRPWMLYPLVAVAAIGVYAVIALRVSSLA